MLVIPLSPSNLRISGKSQLSILIGVAVIPDSVTLDLQSVLFGPDSDEDLHCSQNAKDEARVVVAHQRPW